MGLVANSNPFSEVSNARAVIHQGSFGDGDTVEIFSLDTLVVGLAVGSHIDSVVLTAVSNRYFDDSLIIIRAGQKTAKLNFYFSFHDTGWQPVTIQTFRGGTAIVRTASPHSSTTISMSSYRPSAN